MTYGNYPDLKKVKKILVIKMRHHGDVLLTSPVFSNLKKAIPDARIDAYIYKDTLPMLEGHPDIFHFFLYDRSWKKLSLFKRIFKEIQLLFAIRRQKYDLVVNLTEGDRGAIAAWISGSHYAVGFHPQGKGLIGKERCYTHLTKNCVTARHTVEKQLDVLRSIGIFPAIDDRDLFLHIPEKSKQKALALLQTAEIEIGKYVLIHAVSRWRFKCLPPEIVAEVIKELSRCGLHIVLTGSSDIHELSMNQEILKHVTDANVLNLSGKTDLKELAALIHSSKSLICVDSVPLHIASALKVPVVAVFGPTSDQNWGPWMHPRSRVVAQKFSCRPCFLDGCGGSKMSDCLYTLSVSSILSALASVMRECESDTAFATFFSDRQT